MRNSSFTKGICCVVAIVGMGVGIAVSSTSCSYRQPSFVKASDGFQQWSRSSFSVQANWIGYYSKDVNCRIDIPQGNLYDPNTGQGDVSYSTSKESAYPTESLKISFEIHTENTDTSSTPINIKITWYVQHTNFSTITNEQIIPTPQNLLFFKSSFYANSQPNMNFGDQSKLPGTVSQPIYNGSDSFSSVNGYYNSQNYGNGDQTCRANIQQNLTNDLLYYQWLVFQNLKKLLVANIPVLGNIYVSLDEASWRFDVLVKYNIDTQIFDYIQINATAQGDFGLIKSVATLNLNYAWGNNTSEIHNSQKSYDVLQQFNDKDNGFHHFTINDCVGPRLLGSYSINHQDERFEHTPQDSENLPAYSQNFLSLVPSNLDSYQMYDVCLHITNNIFSAIIGDYLGSGYHVYFHVQPRMFGLEFATNSRYISTWYPPGGNTGRDSFGNLQLSIPSCALTNVSYHSKDQTSDNTGFILPESLPTITQCKVNIDTVPPKIYNYVNDGQDLNEMCKRFFGSTWSEPTHQDDFVYDISGDSKSNLHPIDPDLNWLDTRMEHLHNCVNSIQNEGGHDWDHISITNPAGGSQLEVIPWWQCIQAPAAREGSGSEVTDWDLKGYAEFFDEAYPGNLSFDSTNWKFTRFALGLNYMFAPSTTPFAADADNVFAYTGTLLDQIIFTNCI